jgi:flagellar protein FlbD
MIELEKLSGGAILVNPDHIRFIESCPDSLVTFFDGKTLIVRTSIQEIQQKIINYKKGVSESWMHPSSSVSY